jgi:predicted nuclease with TOPRIM domain
MNEEHNRMHERIDNVHSRVNTMEVNMGRHEEQLTQLKEQGEDFKKGFRAIETKVTKNTVITNFIYAVGLAVVIALFKGLL